MTPPTLSDLRNQIARYGPEHFCMSTYLTDVGNSAVANIYSFTFDKCGSIGCVAGHGAILMRDAGMTLDEDNWSLQSRDYFGLPAALVGIMWSKVVYRDRFLNQQYEMYCFTGTTPADAMYFTVLDWLDWQIELGESVLQSLDFKEETSDDFAYAT